MSDNKPLDTQISIPFGISYIATVLKNQNYYPHILVLTPQMNIERIVQEFIDKYHPALFCLTTTSSQFTLMIRVAEAIKKKNNKIFTILGGVHASLNPEEAIKIPVFDAICIGEGEKAVTEIAYFLNKKEYPASINNLWIKDKNSGAIEKNPPDDFIQDLDRLPFIDRTLWYNWIDDLDSRPSVLVGRGCPNKCSYCSNHALSRLTKGKYVRFRSPENVVQEITEIIEENPNIRSIYLEVETLSVNLNYTHSLLNCLRKFNEGRPVPIEFGANVSPQKKIIENEDFFIQLKKANFTSINIGLESGCERVRKEILRRPQYSNEDIVTFCSLARKHGIFINMYVMVGIPGETKKEFNETIECVRKCAPDFVQLGIFEPYPGTDLYSSGIEQGFVDPKKLEMLKSGRCHALINLPGFSKDAIQSEYFLFNYRALGKPIPIIHIIAWFCDRVFGRLCFIRLLQKIRDKKYAKMQLSDFE